MKKQKSIWAKKILATSLISCTLVFASQLATQAQPSSKIVTAFNITFDPPNESQPRATKGGASRGSQCAIDSQESLSFIPVLPATNHGLTTASHPTILAYVPDTSAQSVFLSIQDENEEAIYQSVLPIGDRTGVVSLEIPQEAPALETGKTYKWSFALMCDNQLRPDSPIIEGYIERVQPEPELAAQLERATPVEKAALYGQAGIWYETVATLAQLKEAEPQNQELINAWDSILNSVGLEKVSNARLIE